MLGPTAVPMMVWEAFGTIESKFVIAVALVAGLEQVQTTLCLVPAVLVEAVFVGAHGPLETVFALQSSAGVAGVHHLVVGTLSLALGAHGLAALDEAVQAGPDRRAGSVSAGVLLAELAVGRAHDPHLAPLALALEHGPPTVPTGGVVLFGPFSQSVLVKVVEPISNLAGKTRVIVAGIVDGIELDEGEAGRLCLVLVVATRMGRRRFRGSNRREDWQDNAGIDFWKCSRCFFTSFNLTVARRRSSRSNEPQVDLSKDHRSPQGLQSVALDSQAPL